jgi:hypothetical protein
VWRIFGFDPCSALCAVEFGGCFRHDCVICHHQIPCVISGLFSAFAYMFVCWFLLCRVLLKSCLRFICLVQRFSSPGPLISIAVVWGCLPWLVTAGCISWVAFMLQPAILPASAAVGLDHWCVGPSTG